MDPMYWIKLGLVALGCFALYLVAWPIPNLVEKLLKQRRSATPGAGEDTFLDYLAGEGERLAAEKHRAESLPIELEQRVVAFALAQNLTRAEAHKVLIEAGLAAEARQREAAARLRPIMVVHRSS